jgi:S-adenosylmethionine-diacylgycerolhomoserine-N-methlytransferase
MANLAAPVSREELRAIQRYYRMHARIYDLTRWTFLRGRAALRSQVAKRLNPARILEVGCGTGTNLWHLGRRFPQAALWGLDLSADMLAVARAKLAHCGPRLTLVKAAYDQPVSPEAPFDLVVFSYALSMFNPGWEVALNAAKQDLGPGGAIAVVDFCDSPLKAFKRWMGVNHVRLDGHLLPCLTHLFPVHTQSVNSVYGGLWNYFIFLGQSLSRETAS